MHTVRNHISIKKNKSFVFYKNFNNFTFFNIMIRICLDTFSRYSILRVQKFLFLILN